MIYNLIFSLDVALPIFLVMSIGYLLKKNGVINDNFIMVANKMVFYVALPIKLFNDVRQVTIKEALDIQFFSFAILGTIFSAILCWAISYGVIKEKSQRGSFIQGAFRGNFLYIGFSVLENVMGSIGIKAPMVVALIIPLYNILGVMIFSFNRIGKEVKTNVGDTILKIVKNPLIIAIFSGILASAINLKVPIFVSRSMKYFQDLATPLALITIGATFDFEKITDSIKPIIVASVLKLGLIPLIAVVTALFMGFNNNDIFLVYVLFGVPTATVSFTMAAAMNGDKGLASNIVMVTTLLSVVFMTIFILAFKTMEII
ncbi:AEC family transporter [Irregularibacter muris]|uniref:AEC family transporter n=1 Tax=Irregularibacter muris TaxID=1796619 RepID=A0AAE3L2K3_9FIRM|nr:AEC family transporter [Irregularibacter muris]MCR1898739.1 AEC family transporter [Irregularibacter muris]